MKLTLFQSDKGDCLMLETGGKRMLVDGGMRHSYTRHVAPTMGELRRGRQKLDLVYVSHIDRDHVFGVLQMMEDLVAWRVSDFHRTAPGGDRRRRRPRVERPPEIGGIWHNVFHEVVGRNAGPIADMLAASARALSGLSDADLDELHRHYGNLASSMADAVELSRRVGAEQLRIPVNEAFGGKLALRDRRTIRFGRANLQVVGPSKGAITKLRRDWNKWLRSEAGERRLRGIRRAHAPDEDILGLSAAEGLLALRRSRAEELGRRSRVSRPNLASLMLLVEEGHSSILLTGDGHWRDILEGLEDCGKVNNGGGCHLSVLKVPHHGSEHNVNLEFCQRITADHYVFCGNGAHHNPDLRVLDIFAKSRAGRANERSANPQAGDPCTFWFSSSSSYPHGRADDKAHMAEVEERMRRVRERSGGQIEAKFLKDDKLEVPL